MNQNAGTKRIIKVNDNLEESHGKIPFAFKSYFIAFKKTVKFHAA